ncbi:Fpg/Nei family DNA glycosylase [Pendulispora albinea]|uniref:DNA-(apurinic or apyrimidinic site) lyase n=1 Tax=Pendulispora albinea TaxID=2741071 RepID=A0ABZ2LK31_9BACT
MPELPDVEMARRDLQRWLRGAEITAAQSTDRYIARGSPPGFKRSLMGRTVKKVSRRGKWLRIELDDGAYGRLFSHLGMTGSWTRVELGAPTQRWERARFDLTHRGRTSSVRYIDSRRFGRLVLAREDIEEWTSLGPDPLVDGIDESALFASLARRRQAIKDVLMDQSILAGIGNILVTEALWLAKVDPRSPGDALTRDDVSAVAQGLRAALEQELGERARGQPDVFSVYGHAGKPCPRCTTPFVRIVLGGRGTTFCVQCQPRRDAVVRKKR